MKKKIALAAVALLLVAALVFHNALLGAIGGYLVNASPPEKADIAVVLAGDQKGLRILKGAELVREGFVPRAIVSGPSGFYGNHECDVAIPFAERAGYPAAYFIHAEHDARSTVEEAKALLPVLHHLGAHRVLVVTSDYHTRRAGRILRRTLPDFELITVAAPDAEFSANGWWHSREGRKIALYEWMKTVADWFRI